MDSTGVATIIVGAGETGCLISSKSKERGFRVVGFVDDDPNKLNSVVNGFKVLGTIKELMDVVHREGVKQVIIAIPSASGSVVDRISSSCLNANVTVRTVPAFFALLSGEAHVEDLRPLSIQDLLQREHRVKDVTVTLKSDVFRGKVALVTGAGGSIGSSLCQQLLLSDISQLVVLGHGENSIFELLKRVNRDSRVRPVIADIRDYGSMEQVMRQYKPHLVFHAAAHKHVGLMEHSLAEAIGNNVMGTANVARAAEQSGAERFVMVSTDKAVNPFCVMGVTKRVAEKLVLCRPPSNTKFYVVRFGNVLGSRGSVVPIFEERIARQQPLHVTDPDVERFFISVEEACFLVLEACCDSNIGGLFVLDMGKPIKIVDLARNVLRLRGKTEAQCPIIFTGLVKGEKMSEELFHAFEVAERGSNGIFVAKPGFSADPYVLSSKATLLTRAAQQGQLELCFSLLKDIVPEYSLPDPSIVLPPRPHAPWPYFEDDEVRKVTEIVQSGKVNYWTGPEGMAFEKEFAAFVGTKYALAIANGTVALELALKILGIGPGDEVVVPSRTYIASASCAAIVGARPIVADVDPVYGLITRATIEAVLTPRTRAIVVVHIGGWPCEMDEIMALAKEKNLFVVEDCAQSHGAIYKGRQVGSIGHVNAFSFCQDKIMTTCGEGGMICLNDFDLWKRAWSYKDIGRDYDAVFNQQHPPGFRWLTHSFGTNWRMTEAQSAVGRIQLRKLQQWVQQRRHNADRLQQQLRLVPGLRMIEPPQHMQPSYYKYYCFVQLDTLDSEWTRDKIVTALNAQKVQAFSGSCCEIYREKAFPEEWKPKDPLPNAKVLTDTSLMLLVHPTLPEEDINYTVQKIIEVMNQARKK